MKVLLQIIALSSLISINFSCNNNKVIDNDAINIKVDEIISNEPVNFSKLFSDFHLIPLESNEECVFSRINNIKLIGDTIFIFDRLSTKSVYLFSKQGKFLIKISKIGRGPGEYMQLSDFDINEETVFIFDWATKKISKYDTKGNFLSDVKLKYRFSSFISLGDDILAFKPFPENRSKQEAYLLYLLDNDGNVIWKKLKYSDFLHGTKIIEFIDGGNFFKSENDIKFHMNYSNTIFSIKNNTVNPFIILHSEKYELTEQDLDILKSGNPSIFMQTKFEKLSMISGYSENNNLAFFKFYIGLSEYKSFYYFRTKKIICSNRYNDDLTFIFPNLFGISNKQLIGYVDPRRVPKFKELIASGKIKTNEIEKNKILNFSDLDNPIIILYDVKEN